MSEASETSAQLQKYLSGNESSTKHYLLGMTYAEMGELQKANLEFSIALNMIEPKNKVFNDYIKAQLNVLSKLIQG